jgi:membrane fusion protein (multidrug efflux system)
VGRKKHQVFCLQIKNLKSTIKKRTKMEKQTPKKSRKTFIILAVIFILVASIGGYAWIKASAYETTDDAQLAGNIFSVRAGVTAYLDAICFQDNQHVNQGDTLLIFDTVALKASVAKAKGALENARAGLSVSDIKALAQKQSANASLQTALSGKQNIAVAKANLDQAQSDFNRAQKLMEIKAVTKKDYDAYQTTLKQAEAQYEQAVHNQQSSVLVSTGLKSEAKAAHQQISAAAALVDQSVAELRLAEEQLSHAYIIAPCNGIVTKRSVDQGQYVLAGQSLCAVVDEQHLWITANFKETQLRNIKPGQPVKIRIDAYPGLELKGTVQSYSGATGASFSLIPPDNATSNFIKVTQRVPLRINIQRISDPENNSSGNQENSEEPSLLFPGLSAFVKVKID